MKAILALTFLAVTNAAYPIYDEGYGYDDQAPISPLWPRAIFQRYGFIKPAYDADFISFAKSIGISDYPTASHLHSLYHEPAVLFFLDPTGGIVSYYADEGIEKAFLSPELRDVFPSVLGAADSMAILYHPDSVLGRYKSVLPGQFFVPSHSAILAKIMRSGIEASPFPVEHVILKKPEIADIFPDVSPIHARFDIDEFPFAYKSPVTLSLFSDHYDGPITLYGSYKSAFPGFGDLQYYPLYSKVAHALMDGVHSANYLKSGYPLIGPETPAYHSGFYPALKFPLAKHLTVYGPLSYAKPSYNILHYTSPIAPDAPVTPISIDDPADSLRAFNPYYKASPGYLPRYYAEYFPENYPTLRYPASFYTSPIILAAAGAGTDYPI